MDWNSLSVDRYYEDLNSNNEVGIGILDISRDIDNDFVAKRTFDMTYFYINRMIKMNLCSYVGRYTTVSQILEKFSATKCRICSKQSAVFCSWTYYGQARTTSLSN